MSIVVIDYGLGNLTSVYNALAYLGANPRISESAADVKSADKLVLPGVGAFQDAIKGLGERKLLEPLKDALSSGKVYLGICLGLQILFEESEEGGAEGLGLLKGKVKRFREDSGVKVPHIGWNKVDRRPKTEDYRLMKGIDDSSYFYFDHSYYAEPKDKGIIAGTTDYGIDFASMVSRDSIYAVQFHPERSQSLGLKLLKNFVDI